MKKRIAVLFVAFPIAIAFGQTIRPAVDTAADPWKIRLDRASKMFPPDLAAPKKRPIPTRLSRSYCVYPSPVKGALAFKPCQTTPRRLDLIPLFRTSAPVFKR
jgi:hypothetical protein